MSDGSTKIGFLLPVERSGTLRGAGCRESSSCRAIRRKLSFETDDEDESVFAGDEDRTAESADGLSDHIEDILMPFGACASYV